MQQICDMGPIILLLFLSPFKNPTVSAGFEPTNLGIKRPACYLCTTEAASLQLLPPRQFARICHSVNMEWGVKENHVAFIRAED